MWITQIEQASTNRIFKVCRYSGHLYVKTSDVFDFIGTLLLTKLMQETPMLVYKGESFVQVYDLYLWGRDLDALPDQSLKASLLLGVANWLEDVASEEGWEADE
ncbi:TPA: hypothetical protein ACGIY5_001452 [Corynebacterium striatum]